MVLPREADADNIVLRLVDHLIDETRKERHSDPASSNSIPATGPPRPSSASLTPAREQKRRKVRKCAPKRVSASARRSTSPGTPLEVPTAPQSSTLAQSPLAEGPVQAQISPSSSTLAQSLPDPRPILPPDVQDPSHDSEHEQDQPASPASPPPEMVEPSQPAQPLRRSTRKSIKRVGPSHNKDDLAGTAPLKVFPSRRGLSEYSSGNRDLSAKKWMYVSRSDIHGKGGFANRLIEEGTTIAEYTGVRRDSPREVTAPTYLSDYVAEISGGVTIDALDPIAKRVGCSAGFLNDGFDPEGANARFEERNGRLFVVAARRIAENEEIRIAYGPGYWLSSK